ncbi:MAG: hypothetical protein ACERKO_05360 [Acetanaerobacterium sp.]
MDPTYRFPGAQKPLSPLGLSEKTAEYPQLHCLPGSLLDRNCISDSTKKIHASDSSGRLPYKTKKWPAKMLYAANKTPQHPNNAIVNELNDKCESAFCQAHFIFCGKK